MSRKKKPSKSVEIRNKWLQEQGWDPKILQAPAKGQIITTKNPDTPTEQVVSVQNVPTRPINTRFDLTQDLQLQNPPPTPATALTTTTPTPGDTLSTISLKTTTASSASILQDDVIVSLEWGIMDNE